MVGEFFGKTFELQTLLKGVAAYNRALDLADEVYVNPDLHYNLGKVLKYLEDFKGAKVQFDKAHGIDGSLGGDGEKRDIEEWFKKVGDMVGRKGRVKEKNIQVRLLI